MTYKITPVNSFGAALEELRKGKKLSRSGWNGGGVCLQLQSPDENSKMNLPYIYIEYPKGHPIHPDGCRVPWQPSQIDILAMDWSIMEEQ